VGEEEEGRKEDSSAMKTTKGVGGPLALNGYNMKPSCCSLVNIISCLNMSESHSYLS
jgi:hypothetical protein